MSVSIHPANIRDPDGGIEVTKAAFDRFPGLRKLWADSGYTRSFIQAIEASTAIGVEVVKRPGEGRRRVWTREGKVPEAQVQPSGFHVVHWRWIVERTFAWLSRYRRLTKDYEESVASSLAWLHLALIRMLARRLA